MRKYYISWDSWFPNFIIIYTSLLGRIKHFIYSTKSIRLGRPLWFLFEDFQLVIVLVLARRMFILLYWWFLRWWFEWSSMLLLHLDISDSYLASDNCLLVICKKILAFISLGDLWLVSWFFYLLFSDSAIHLYIMDILVPRWFVAHNFSSSERLDITHLFSWLLVGDFLFD